MDKYKHDTFDNVKMVLTKMFEEAIKPDFHSDSQGLATRGFGTTPPVEILTNLQCLYVKSIYQELDAVLLQLKEPIN